jgi:hypothetical protein
MEGDNTHQDAPERPPGAPTGPEWLCDDDRLSAGSAEIALFEISDGCGQWAEEQDIFQQMLSQEWV